MADGIHEKKIRRRLATFTIPFPFIRNWLLFITNRVAETRQAFQSSMVFSPFQHYTHVSSPLLKSNAVSSSTFGNTGALPSGFEFAITRTLYVYALYSVCYPCFWLYIHWLAVFSLVDMSRLFLLYPWPEQRLELDTIMSLPPTHAFCLVPISGTSIDYIIIHFSS
jgi:hypothetical protein